MKNLELPKNWVAASDPVEAAKLEEELIREAPLGHLLYGLKARVIARHEYMDDVLFQLGDGTYAEVHLTWLLETNPDWPTTEMIKSIDEWRDHWNDVYKRTRPVE
jgi:hypothetical protein